MMSRELGKNEYMLVNVLPLEQSDDTPAGNRVQIVSFYEMNEDGTKQDGTTLEEMLRVSIARLKDLNGRFSCRENSIAITKMEEALMWLNARTQDRIKRGVEGTHAN